MCPRRFPLFALSLFLALSLFPSRAFAYDFIPKGLVYSADLDGSRYGAVAVAANQFDAACYVLGKEPASISTSIRSKLSDPNYGGRFYEFSQAFYTQGWPLEHVPDWLPVYVWGSVELNDFLLSDYQSVWYVTCTQSLRAGALVDFLTVLNGGDLGGGGDDTPSSPVSGEPLVFTGNPHLNNWGSTVSTGNYYAIRDSNKNAVASVDVTNRGGLPVVPAPVTFTVSNYGSFSFDPSQYNFYMYVGYWSNNSNDVYFGIFAVPSTTDVNLVSRANGGGADVWYCNATFPSTTCYSINLRGKYSYSDGSFTVSSFYYNTGWSSSSRSTIGDAYNYSVKGMECIYTYGSGGPVSPPPPAGTWPEPSTPAAPVEPTLPDPVTPTVQPDPVVTDPTVTWPVIPTPTDPTVTLTDTPSGLDYTQLLTLINDNLNDINSYTVAINSNFNSLRSDLVTEFDSVVQALRNIYQYLQHLDDVLERHCVHLQNKLEDVSVDIQNKIREMVRWLADELDFGSEESGNSSLFGILSTINDKLGGGTYEPNPLKSEDSYYEWLDDLWDRFLLGDDWQSSVSGISSSFGQLKTRFPFSVPWDIVALFRLFVHDPVTPVFDLPLYFSADSSTPVHVDLSAWDDVASIVRPLVYVIFALKLALLSRDLLGGLGADKGGL